MFHQIRGGGAELWLFHFILKRGWESGVMRGVRLCESERCAAGLQGADGDRGGESDQLGTGFAVLNVV